MFHRPKPSSSRRPLSVLIETLEGRQFLSAAPHAVSISHITPAAASHHHKHHKNKAARSTAASTGASDSGGESTVAYSMLNSTIQSGLQAIAPSGVTITPTQTVDVHTTTGGGAIYSVDLQGTNSETEIAVDQTGARVTQTGDSGTESGDTGNETGDGGQEAAFSTLSTVVQNGLRSLAPAGTTIDPTQQVEVQTNSTGATVYSAELKTSGEDVKIAVDSTGAAVTQTSDSGGGDNKGGSKDG